MSYSLNSLKGGIRGFYRGVSKGISRETRSFDYSSYKAVGKRGFRYPLSRNSLKPQRRTWSRSFAAANTPPA